ncbi:MAG: MFS transporter [Spirochaetota bacterium]
MQVRPEKLKLINKIGYGVGDIYGGGALGIIAFYYLYFLTDTMQISPGLAGTAFLVSKIWDAVSDPLMGILSDRTRTRFGRRRPYFLAGVVFIFLSFFLMWIRVDLDTEFARFIYAVGTYLFFSTVFTMVWVPYMAIASEMTANYHERTQLATFRMVCSNIGGILGATLPLQLVGLFESDRIGFSVMGAAFGVFFALPYLMTFFTTFEPEEFRTQPRERVDFKAMMRQNFIEPFRLRSFRLISYMYLCTFVAQDAIMALVIYFLTYYLHMADFMTPLLGAVYGTIIIAIPLVGKLAGRIGKCKTYTFAACLWIVAFTYTFFIRPSFPSWSLFVFGVIFGFALGGTQVMVMAIFPDIPDIDELFSGRRREGIFSGLFAFLRKVSSALAIFLISMALDLAGYVKPVEQMVDGVLQAVEQPQNGGFVLVLRLMFALLPISLITLGLISSLRFPLTPELHRRLKNFLPKFRDRAGEELPANEAAERDNLIKMLN